jgi:hypothetical protein
LRGRIGAPTCVIETGQGKGILMAASQFVGLGVIVSALALFLWSSFKI